MPCPARPARLRPWRRLARSVGVITLVVATACGDDGATPSAADGTEATLSTAPRSTVQRSGASSGAPGNPTIASTAPASTTPSSTTPGDDAAEAALTAVMSWLADPGLVDPDRFSPAFLEAVPVEEITATFEAMGGPWEVVGSEAAGAGALVALIEGPGPPGLVELSVSDDGRIDSLRLRPAEVVDPPATLAALVERVAATAPTTAFLRADVDAAGSCISVAELRSGESVPVGSIFKLYVLWAVAEQIASGELTWDHPVPIRDELDSFPTGITQDDPAGSSVTVRELARRMIEISDNTATDHLMNLVGRDQVEQALVTLGHHRPADTLPLLTTRELFTIKADPELVARYAAADEVARRAILDEEIALQPLPPLESFPPTPVAPTTVEWFASPDDICRALVALDDRAEAAGLEPIREILSANPGVAADPATFPQILHKGGSEVGLLAGAWLATRPDGSRIAVVGSVADDAADVDPLALQLLGLGLTLT